MKKRILGVAFAAVLALAGCGGGGDSNDAAGGDSVDLGSGKAYQAAGQSQQIAYQAFGEALGQMNGNLGASAQVVKDYVSKSGAGAFKAALGECQTSGDTVTCSVTGEAGGSCVVSVAFEEVSAARYEASVDLNCDQFKEDYFYLDGHYVVDIVVDGTNFGNMAAMQVKSSSSHSKAAASKAEEGSNECLATEEYELYEGCSETADTCADGDADFLFGTSLRVISELTVIVYDDTCADGYKAVLPAGFTASGAFCFPSDTVIDITSTQQSQTQSWSCDFSEML